MKPSSIPIMVVAVFILSIATAAFAECPGDFDCDGDVDARDLTVLAQDFGSDVCGPCASTVNLQDYRAPVGMIKTVTIRSYMNQEPWFYDRTYTISTFEAFTRWTLEDGSFEDYYADREEFYDTEGILYWTCIHDPSEVESLPEGPKRVGESWGGVYRTTCNGTSRRMRLVMFTLLDIEDVTVPAGTFANCLKIFRNRGSESTASILWYAPGMGWIKRAYEGSASGGSEYAMTAYQLPN